MFSNENTFLAINNGNISNPGTIYDSFINAIDELARKIYSCVENILHSKDEPSLDELIENLKDSLNETENIFSNIDFFKEEYYDLSSIKDMAFYILDDIALLDNISIVKCLLNSFFNIIHTKKDSSKEEYEKRYEKFSSILVDVEQIFYTKIYQPSENYDEDALSEIFNLLLG